MSKYFKQEEGFSYFSKPNPCIISTISSDLNNTAPPYHPNTQEKKF